MKNTGYVLTGVANFEKRELPIPEVLEDDVLIQIEYMGICGSDIHAFNGDFGDVTAAAEEQGIMIGHECAGTVVKTGKNVTKIKEGDRVAVEAGIGCGKCDMCKQGLYNLCRDMRFLGCPPDYKGAMQRYMSYPSAWVFKLPDDVSSLEGALIEPLSVGLHATNISGIGLGDSAVIFGAGCIGLTVLLSCLAKGVSDVVVVDVFESRLQTAKKLGASAVLNSSECDVIKKVIHILGEEPKYIFEAAGNPVAAEMCMKLIGRAGVITLVGALLKPSSIIFEDISEKEVTIKTVFRYRNIYPTAINAIAEGIIDLKTMVNKVFDFEEAQHAFEEAAAQKQEIVKAVLKF
ncbi:alcohol dehydrogenase catalytic domain-containing protein [Butyricicoccus faecihominis]|uniref:alcohol dehydrogenase catalytic domain-containing protein n=2 Tax=Bacteria TaxID=2 RepID=UPI0024785396|nr:alcohol dehydrogenase catalytic domain-containing protein [Butyricicoccus faecihominis]MCQ5130122.1 alcohol dehydrogenase catalytic domain-containing protein [Butyricicoccus faecihominis]